MYLTPEKRYPYWAEPPRIGYFRILPPPPPHVLRYALHNVDSRISRKNESRHWKSREELHTGDC